MAAILTSTGITFSDATALNSKYGIVPQNSVSTFFQSTAPVGWSQNTTATVNNKALRVVNGTGGGTGGTSSFTTVFPNSLRPISQTGVPMTGSVGNTTLTTAQLPSHTHGANGTDNITSPGTQIASGSGWNTTSPATGATGGGQAHNHPFGSGTASFSTNVDLRLQYIDVIVCSFD